MKEVMSLSEIKQQFDSEWVLIGDPKTSEDFTVQAGTVLWHSKDRDELYRKAREMHPGHSAILYLGKLPDNAAVIL